MILATNDLPWQLDVRFSKKSFFVWKFLAIKVHVKRLVTNYREVGGGATKWERGQQRKFYPYKKGETENVLGKLRGGGTISV